MDKLIVFAFLLTSIAAVQATSFRFANNYGDHMVLQRSPHAANVWGFIPECDPVTIAFNGKDISATLIPESGGGCRWRGTLPPTTDIGPYVITASSSKYGSKSISDVLFGDVWVCSGQSNMAFTVPMVFNASEEIAKAAAYPHIRLFTASLITSDVPLDELQKVEQNWTVGSSAGVNGGDWTYFSAVCWFWGRDLYDYLKYPIGLVDTNWGGTRVEAWSSPDALKKCPQQSPQSSEYSEPRPGHAEAPDPNQPSVLWNAMVYPLLNMTIKGAVWYQGESNSGYTNYNCTFPAMIDDWRAKWYSHSGGQTDQTFPFGFVQLAADGTSNVTVGGFPTIRWAQTANYGYVPNGRMKNVFMAVAIDLGDPTSPFGSVHIRDKQDVGARLVLAGRAIAYGDSTVYYTGPIANGAKLSSSNVSSLVQVSVSYGSVAQNGLELRYPYGFELGCVTSTGAADWFEGTAVKVDGNAVIVELPACPSGQKAVMIRYCWRTDPCTFKKCPVYSSDLPSPPFMMELE